MRTAKALYLSGTSQLSETRIKENWRENSPSHLSALFFVGQKVKSDWIKIMMSEPESKILEELDREIEKTIKELKEANRRKREAKLAEKPREKKKRGRKPMSNEMIAKARELAKTKSIPSVALKLEVALTTLYKYNIKRKVLNAENSTDLTSEETKISTENQTRLRKTT